MEATIELKKIVEVVALGNFDLEQYKTIFINDPRRIDLLENTAHAFFNFLRRYYWDRFAIDISRITDVRFQNKGENLTIDIFEEIAEKNDFDFIEEIKINNKKIRELAKYFRERRNKITAHIDIKYATGRIEFIPDTKALQKVEEIYNLLKRTIFHFYKIYEAQLPPVDILIVQGDAHDLMKYLRKGYNATIKITDPETPLH
ncbi:MAG: hypothetical protein R6V48_03340 [Fidelibacterota bacterium]